MFYRPENGHGLPHNPFSAIISPRPIGWVSTRASDGTDNLAPYSFFNGVAYTPPQVMFASTTTKDSLANIRQTGVFCINIVSAALMNAMNTSSENFPSTVDEFERAGLERSQCDTIECARVTASPASLECRLTDILALRGDDNHAIFGEVTGIHLSDDCVVDGRFDVTRYHPLARLGYRDYTVVRDIFEQKRPDDQTGGA